MNLKKKKEYELEMSNLLKLASENKTQFNENEISSSLEYARKYANKGNVILVKHHNNIIRRNIQELYDNFSTKMQEYEREMSNLLQLASENKTQFHEIEISSSLEYARESASNGNREMLNYYTKKIRGHIDEIKDKLEPQKIQEYELEMFKLLKLASENKTQFHENEISSSLEYARKNASNGNREMLNYYTKKIRGHINEIKDKLGPQKIQDYENELKQLEEIVNS